MALTQQQIAGLKQAVLSAFRTYEDLEQMLRLTLGWKLNELVNRGPLDRVAYDLIVKADEREEAPVLVEAILLERPRGSEILKFVDEFPHLLLGSAQREAADPYYAVRRDLARARDDEHLSAFRPLIEMLQLALKPQFPDYPVNAFHVFIGLLQQISAGMRSGWGVGYTIKRVKVGTLTVEHAGFGAEEIEQARAAFGDILGKVERKIRDAAAEPEHLVPIVLLAMTRTQAQELDAETAFSDLPDALRNDFRDLRALLLQEGVAEWLERYGDTPLDWRPFGGARDVTIEALIHKTLEDFNNENKEQGQPPLSPELVDIVSLGAQEKRRDLHNLRECGCIVVIDAVSMRHPALQRAFHHAMLDAYDQTSFVTLAPHAAALEAARELSIVLQLRHEDLELSKRRGDRNRRGFDSSAVRDIIRLDDFEGWIVDRSKKFWPEAQRGDTGIRDLMWKP
jgi:hypothetical protein